MSTGGYLSATAGSWRRGCGRPAWTKSRLTGKLLNLAGALLRQLAGMGNNLNQIARRVNAGGGTGHDRVQIVAALMAIDAGLERLRHAVLEKGTDDDR
jgi:hypothetical protein